MITEPVKGLYRPNTLLLYSWYFNQVTINLTEKTSLEIWVLTLDSFSHINVVNGYAWWYHDFRIEHANVLLITSSTDRVYGFMHNKKVFDKSSFGNKQL